VLHTHAELIYLSRSWLGSHGDKGKASKKDIFIGRAAVNNEQEYTEGHCSLVEMGVLMVSSMGCVGGGVVSPPAPGTNWVDWSNALGWEMYLHRALAKLNAEYPLEADCDFLTHWALKADGSDSH
jgi:hypothetical protein